MPPCQDAFGAGGTACVCGCMCRKSYGGKVELVFLEATGFVFGDPELYFKGLGAPARPSGHPWSPKSILRLLWTLVRKQYFILTVQRNATKSIHEGLLMVPSIMTAYLQSDMSGGFSPGTLYRSRALYQDRENPIS